MDSLRTVTQSPERRKKRSAWIAGVVALAAVAAMTGCAKPPPAQQELPTPTPAPEVEKAATHTVTIAQEAGEPACTVSPFKLGDVDGGDLVTFKNETGSQAVTFEFPPELFGTTSITVPAGSSVTLVVSDTTQPGSPYEYSVSCLPPAEARPRIVIRGTTER